MPFLILEKKKKPENPTHIFFFKEKNTTTRILLFISWSSPENDTSGCCLCLSSLECHLLDQVQRKTVWKASPANFHSGSCVCSRDHVICLFKAFQMKCVFKVEQCSKLGSDQFGSWSYKAVLPSLSVYLSFFWDIVSQCSPGCSGTLSIGQAGLESTEVHQPLSPKYWD